MAHKSPSGDEFFDCVSNVKYCAVASPKGVKAGEVFLDFTEAHDKLKQIKGSRMKLFDNYADAQSFAKTPVETASLANVYPPSPKADIESTPFSSVSQGQLARFRSFIEAGDLEHIRSSVNENPLFLVTPSDTPTLLQIRLRYNALHIAASVGVPETIELLLSYLNSGDFWKRIYPETDEQTTRERQWRVVDLYLNSPELGNLDTPLHFASKFGHVTCTRLLACHPFAQLHLRNRYNQTPSDLAATRLCETVGMRRITESTTSETPLRLAVLSNAVRRALDENFVVLAEVNPPGLQDLSKICILPPLSLHQFQSLLALVVCRALPGLLSLFPFLSLATSFCISPKRLLDSEFGAPGQLRVVRAFAGPLLSSDAQSFRTKWQKANSSSCCKEFASIRLSDPEKGYERQGRFIARMFGTQWFEYWEFLDDYLDLSCESGLSILDDHLRKNLSSDSSLWYCNDEDVPSESANCLWSTSSCAAFEFEPSAPSTPIVRQRVSLPESTGSPWYKYRSQPVCSTVLDDSLGASEGTPSLQTLSDDGISETKNETVGPSALSPLLDLLRKWTFASPLRWLLVDGPGNSLSIFDSQSGLPPHKKPVSVTTPNTDPSKFSGKRKLSFTEPGHSSFEHIEQPVVKKSSPNTKTSVRKNCLIVPLLKHIYRALPAGDPEMEKAVRALTMHTDDSSGNPLSSVSQVRSLHYTDLSSFRTVAAWKEKMDAIVHSSQKDT